MLKKTALFQVLLLLAATLCFAQVADPGYSGMLAKRGGLGLGYGLPYGGLGLNADVYFIDNLALTAGIGSFGYAPGYAVGLKYLFRPYSKTWRPEILLIYGVNKVLVITDPIAGDKRESYSGFSAGLGSQFMFGKSKKHGFDLGIIYVVSSGIFDRIDELEHQGYTIDPVSRISYYLGYRYAFNFKL
ncbi:MAG TPA: hypothetical protein PLG20_03285 [Candidatus Syntrophosphaera sp.]|jgi:hypothetical protein|nr:hypothetical protein [Candidatus Syntrophosphaera sp.]